MSAIRALQRARSGRLAAVTLAVPASLVADSLTHAVREALDATGASGVEVAARSTAGPLRVLSVEFAR